MITYRIAKINDSNKLAKLHYICAKKQVDAFMHKLGIVFLNQYYKVFLKEKNSLIVLAEEKGELVGFHSGTMFSEEHQLAISKNKLRFGFAALPNVLANLKLLKEIFKRFRSLNKKEGSFRVEKGPRGEYWAWHPDSKDAADSLKMHNIWHKIMKEMGASKVRSEVDMTNKRVVKTIKFMGGVFLNEITLDDGRKRAIVEYEVK